MINGQVYDVMWQLPNTDCVRYPDFVRDRYGKFNSRLLCWDNVHLSYIGVSGVERFLAEHLIS